jgi:hypothetical protein
LPDPNPPPSTPISLFHSKCRILESWPNTAIQFTWASHTSPSAARASTTCVT